MKFSMNIFNSQQHLEREKLTYGSYDSLSCFRGIIMAEAKRNLTPSQSA